MRKTLIVLIALALTGCQRERYEIVGTEGVAYLLEKQTGKVWFCTPGNMECFELKKQSLDQLRKRAVEETPPATTTDEWEVFKKK
jgi:hypothetical protein